MEVSLPRACEERYRVERPIASGGYGATLLAVHRELNRPVALKVLHRDHLTDPEQVARFVQEAKVSAALDHPRIVRVYDHGIEDGVPWIAYEYVPGPTVRARMAGGALPWGEAVRVAIEVAEALEAAHAAGVIHRDVKPENVLTAADGGAKLADFGIARWKRSAGVRTATGLVLGTPVYLSPEQCRGDEPTAASDLYALGVMLFEMSMGQPPFVDNHPLALLRRHLEQRVPPLDAALPRALHVVVARALAKEPGARHRSASELKAALEAVTRAAGPATVVVAAAPAARKRSAQKVLDRTVAATRRGPALAALVLGVTCVIGLAGRRVTPPPSPPVPSTTTLTERLAGALDDVERLRDRASDDALRDAARRMRALRHDAGASPVTTGQAAALALAGAELAELLRARLPAERDALLGATAGPHEPAWVAPALAIPFLTAERWNVPEGKAPPAPPPMPAISPDGRRSPLVFDVAPAIVRRKLLSRSAPSAVMPPHWQLDGVSTDLPALAAYVRLAPGERAALPRALCVALVQEYFAHITRLGGQLYVALTPKRKAAKDSRPGEDLEQLAWARSLARELPASMIEPMKAAFREHERLLPEYLPAALQELTSLDDQWNLCRWTTSWYESGHTLGLWDRPVSLSAALERVPAGRREAPARWMLELYVARFAPERTGRLHAGRRLLAALPATCGTAREPAPVPACLTFRTAALARLIQSGPASGIDEEVRQVMKLIEVVEAGGEELRLGLGKDYSHLQRQLKATQAHAAEDALHRVLREGRASPSPR